jgi:hypothetical protein
MYFAAASDQYVLILFLPQEQVVSKPFRDIGAKASRR